MAPKGQSPLEQNPPSASSESEENVEGSDEEGSSSEEEQVKLTQPSFKNTQIPVPKPQPSDDEDEDEEEQDSDAEKAESDSDSGSDSDNEPVNHMIAPRNAAEVKPISSKPMIEPPKSKKPTPTPTTDMPTKGSATVTTKRPLEEDNKKEKRERKKTKKFAELEEEAGKRAGEDKKLFQRVWSEEDEIALLNGLIDFKKKGNSLTNLNGLLDFIKDSVHVTDFTKNKLNNKVQRLKQKYQNNANRAKPGEDPVISRPHELKSYQLSKLIWGDKDDGFEVSNTESESVKADAKKKSKNRNKVNSNGIASPKPKVSTLPDKSLPDKPPKVEPPKVETPKVEPPKVEPKEEVNESGSEYYYLNQCVRSSDFSMAPVVPPFLVEIVAKKGWGSFKSLNAEEFDQRWKDVLTAESKAYLARMELVKDQTQLMLEELQSSNR